MSIKLELKGGTEYEIKIPEWKVPKTSFKSLFNDSLKVKWLNYEIPKELPYSHKLEKNKLFASYGLHFPEKIPSRVNDILINFDYKGNTAQLYLDGIIIADNFYNGTSMPFGLKRHKNKLNNGEFVFQITPLTSIESIYFDEKTDLDFVKSEGAILKKNETYS